MSGRFKRGPRVYIPILEPLGMSKNHKQMHACLSVPMRPFGVELLPGADNEVKLFFCGETIDVNAFALSDAINEALTVQRKSQ